MSTPKQVEANKCNAEKSTGPTTEIGKATSSKNSVKHGLLSKETVLPWENMEEFEALQSELIDALQPQGIVEKLLVDRIASIVWRLKRAGRIETGIIAARRYSLQYEVAMAEIAPLEALPAAKPTTEKRAALDEQMRRSIDHAIDVFPDLPDLGLVFIGEASTFTNLHRYEAGLERSLYKAMHELERLVATRHGKSVPLPLAIDISGDPTQGP